MGRWVRTRRPVTNRKEDYDTGKKGKPRKGINKPQRYKRELIDEVYIGRRICSSKMGFEFLWRDGDFVAVTIYFLASGL